MVCFFGNVDVSRIIAYGGHQRQLVRWSTAAGAVVNGSGAVTAAAV